MSLSNLLEIFSIDTESKGGFVVIMAQVQVGKGAEEINQDDNWVCGLELKGKSVTFFFGT